MTSKPAEASMGDAVCAMDVFRDRGVRFMAEIPYGMKRIDLAGISSDLTVIAIELKVENWRQALWQASVYQLCADLAYVAIREEYTHRVDQSYLGELGIGLISVGEVAARLDLEPERSSVLNPRDHQRLRDALASALLSSEES